MNNQNIIEDINDNDLIKESEFNKVFKNHKRDYDLRYGEVFIKKKKYSQDKIITKTFYTFNKNEALNEILNAKKLLTIQHIHILSFLDYSCGIEKQFCSNQYWINYNIEFLNSDLNYIYNEKMKFYDEFSDEDLMHILYQQIFANFYLENLFHGNINLNNISLDKNKGISKLCLLIKPIENIISYYKMMLIQKRNIYISPKLFKMIFNNKEENYNKNKEDVFSLGLLILELGIMKSINKIYDYEKKFYDIKLFNSLLLEFKVKFKDNILLVSTIENMLIFEENKRDNFTTIYSKLPSYELLIEYFLERNQKLENDK